MPTVNSLPPYITVSYPISTSGLLLEPVERVCRNCRFWQKHVEMEKGLCREIDEKNPKASTFDGHLLTLPDFGCNLFDAS